MRKITLAFFLLIFTSCTKNQTYRTSPQNDHSQYAFFNHKAINTLFKDNTNSSLLLVFENNQDAITKKQVEISHLLKKKNIPHVTLWLTQHQEKESQEALDIIKESHFKDVLYFGYSYHKLLQNFATINPDKTFYILDAHIQPQKNIQPLKYNELEMGFIIADTVEKLKQDAICWLPGGPSKGLELMEKGLRQRLEEINPKARFIPSPTPHLYLWGKDNAVKKQLQEFRENGCKLVVAATANSDHIISDFARDHDLKTVFIDGPSKKYCYKIQKELPQDFVNFYIEKIKTPSTSFNGHWLTLKGNQKNCFHDELTK